MRNQDYVCDRVHSWTGTVFWRVGNPQGNLDNVQPRLQYNNAAHDTRKNHMKYAANERAMHNMQNLLYSTDLLVTSKQCFVISISFCFYLFFGTSDIELCRFKRKRNKITSSGTHLHSITTFVCSIGPIGKRFVIMNCGICYIEPSN